MLMREMRPSRFWTKRRPFWGWVVFLAALIMGTARGEIGADVWTWMDITWLQQGAWRHHLFMHQAAEDGRGPIIQLISPRVKYRVAPWLEAGAGFSWLRIENAATEEWVPQWRPELELNPELKLESGWRWTLRNRLESRWDDGGGKPRPRGRHRLQATRDLKDCGPLSAVYASNEWLFEYDRGDWVENRAVPLGVTLRLTAGSSLDFFYMARSFRRDDGWTSDHIAGVFLKVRL